MTTRPKMLLVDGANIVMRCAFGGDVEVERAVQVATGMLARAVLALRPTHGIVAFDPYWSKAQTWRKALYADYKGHRTLDTTPFLLRAGMEWEQRGWYCVGREGFEADDIIATLATRLRDRCDVVILSNDSDLLALAGQGVTIARPETGGTFKMFNAGDVALKYELQHARQLPDYKALVGETSDNVPGVIGIGAKKASALLAAFPTIEAIIVAHIEGKGGKLAKEVRRVYEQGDVVALAKRLVTLRDDVPVPPVPPSKCAILAPEPEPVAGQGIALEKLPDGRMAYKLPREYPLQACASCAASIIWIVTSHGKRAPVNPPAADGYAESHHATCPQGAEWRARKAQSTATP